MEAAQSILSLVQSALTSVAIVVGGVWGYFLFWRRRQTYPRATLDFHLTTALLPRGKRLLHVGLQILNQSDVLLPLRYAELRVRQVVPIPNDLEALLRKDVDPIPPGSTELPWPAIVGREWHPESGALELEPGESDSLHADFVIEDSVQVVELYAFVQNPRKQRTGLGWTKTVLQLLLKEAAMVDEKKKGSDSGQSRDWVEKQQRQQPGQPSQQVQQQKPTSDKASAGDKSSDKK